WVLLVRDLREANAKDTPLPFFALDFDISSKRRDNTVANREPKASALSDVFGCKEWLKDSASNVAGYPDPGVLNLDHCAALIVSIGRASNLISLGLPRGDSLRGVL